MNVVLGVNPQHLKRLTFDQLCMVTATIIYHPYYLQDKEIRFAAKALGLYRMSKKKVERMAEVYAGVVGEA